MKNKLNIWETDDDICLCVYIYIYKIILKKQQTYQSWTKYTNQDTCMEL